MLFNRERMKTKRDKIRRALHEMLTHAEIDFDMLIAMRKARLEPELHELLTLRYGRFYQMTEHAFFNSVITILYKVFENRADTTNFWTLKKTLSNEGDQQISTKIERKYSEIKKIWIKVSKLRNEVVGHQSLEHSRKESYEIANITISNIKDMIMLCQELLSYIASYFDDIHVVFNLKGAESFELLISDLKLNPPISLSNYKKAFNKENES